MNRKQLEEYIKCEYGQGVDATRYLQKFITLWTSLPKSKESRDSVTQNYIKHCLRRMNFPGTTNAHSNAQNRLIELVDYYDLSLREIEKVLSNYAIAHNANNDGDLNGEYSFVTVYLSIIKVLYPSVFRLISQKKMGYSDLVNQTHLSELEDRYWDEAEKHPLKWIIKYSLSDDADKQKMMHDRRDQGLRVKSVNLQLICSWLDCFETRT